MPRTRSDVELMIEILEDATTRSNKPQEASQPRQFSESQELALIFDLIDAKHVRGEVIDSKERPPRGAAMWGITLSGREYLQKLKTEHDARKLPAKLAKLSWAIGGWLVGIITAGIIAAVSAWLDAIFSR